MFAASNTSGYKQIGEDPHRSRFFRIPGGGLAFNPDSCDIPFLNKRLGHGKLTSVQQYGTHVQNYWAVFCECECCASWEAVETMNKRAEASQKRQRDVNDRLEAYFGGGAGAGREGGR